MYNTGEQPLNFESLNTVNGLGVAILVLQTAIFLFTVAYIIHKQLQTR